MKPRSKRTVAFHEAGHAAMALILGDRLTRVTIRRQKVGKVDAEGHAITYPRSPSGAILHAVAGATSEQIRFRRGYAMGGPDLRQAKALVSQQGVGMFCSAAAQLLRLHWGGVCALASALEERETLRGAEAWEVFCRGLMPPKRKRVKR